MIAASGQTWAEAREETTAATVATVDERFWQRVDKTAGEDACWPWTARRDRRGYGRISVPGRRHFLAHRYAFESAVGPITDGLNVLHSCDNPPCCNPAHLHLGTQADNLAEMRARGRAARWWEAITKCPAGHEYDATNTYVTPSGSRHCRACSRIRAKERYDARRNAACEALMLDGAPCIYRAYSGDRFCGRHGQVAS